MPSQTIKRTMEQKRALIAECRRRMEAGEQARSIYTSLQIPRATFYKWSKIHGFRRGDVTPGHPRARTRVAPGPGAGTSSGRYLRGEGLGRPHSGGRRSLITPEEEARFKAHPGEALAEADEAMRTGNTARADAIIKSVRGSKARERGLEELRTLALTDPDYDHRYEYYMASTGWMTDDELEARWNCMVVTDQWVAFPDKKIPKDFVERWLAITDEEYTIGIARLNSRRSKHDENYWRAEYGLPPLKPGESSVQPLPS